MRALVFSRRLRHPPRTSSSFLPAAHQRDSFMPEDAPPCCRDFHDDSGRQAPLSVYGYPVIRPNYRPCSATAGRISDALPSRHSRPPPP